MGITLDLIDASLHSIKISDGTNDLAIDGSGYITANVNGSVTVTATDLDIRDLSSGTDSVSAVQSGTWDIGTVTTLTGITNDVNIADGGNSITVDDGGAALTVDGTVAATQSGVWNIGTVASITADVSIDDGGNSITVDASDLDIRDLSAAQDNVAISDGTDTLAVNADGSINVQGSLTTTPGGYASWKNSYLSATNTAAELAATPLSGRLRVIVQNTGSQNVYIGPDNTVTSSGATRGIMVPKGSSYEQDLDDGANIWVITPSGTADVVISEYAA